MSFGSGNGLAPNRQQAITSGSDYLIHCCRYASLDLKELNVYILEHLAGDLAAFSWRCLANFTAVDNLNKSCLHNSKMKFIYFIEKKNNTDII